MLWVCAGSLGNGRCRTDLPVWGRRLQRDQQLHHRAEKTSLGAESRCTAVHRGIFPELIHVDIVNGEPLCDEKANRSVFYMFTVYFFFEDKLVGGFTLGL